MLPSEALTCPSLGNMYVGKVHMGITIRHGIIALFLNSFSFIKGEIELQLYRTHDVCVYLSRCAGRASERIPRCSCTRSRPPSSCSESHSRRSLWCIHRYLRGTGDNTAVYIQASLDRSYNCSHTVSHCHTRERLVSLTHAALFVGGPLVTGVTGALVRPRPVHTLTVFTQVVTQLALIHI